LPHRQQKIAVYRGVTFINDSKATTVPAGICAIEATKTPIVLIAGGRDKGSDFMQLRPWVKRLKAAVLIGEDGPKIARCLEGKIPLIQSGSMNEAVKKAFQLASRGNSVLLSPMCASFDMFRDFEDRGEKFVEAVKTVTSTRNPVSHAS
jgi:UDP-N-acetylmuramoylalanine--D-glutamate ligase